MHLRIWRAIEMAGALPAAENSVCSGGMGTLGQELGGRRQRRTGHAAAWGLVRNRGRW